jgi:hypothetical protein
MGSSSGNSVGSSPRWTKPRDILQDVAQDLLDDVTKDLSKRAKEPRTKESQAKEANDVDIDGAFKKALEARRPKADKTKGGTGTGSPAVGGGSTGVRAFGRQLLQAHHDDSRFLPLFEDCTIKLALKELLTLVSAVTIKKRTVQQLYNDYDIETSGNPPGLELSTALDDSLRKHLVGKCEITDIFEKVRPAMINTFVEMLTGERKPTGLLKMTANEILTALRNANSMDIARNFYSNYLYNVLRFLISSNRSNIPPALEDKINDRLRSDFCDSIASKIVERARQKGWSASQIPEKTAEWMDLLITEEIYV